MKIKTSNTKSSQTSLSFNLSVAPSAWRAPCTTSTRRPSLQQDDLHTRINFDGNYYCRNFLASSSKQSTRTPTQATPSFIHYHRTGTVSVRRCWACPTKRPRCMIFALCSSHRCHCVCRRESFSQLMAMPEVCNHCIFQGPSPIFSALQSSQDITKTHKQQQNQNIHHIYIYTAVIDRCVARTCRPSQ